MKKSLSLILILFISIVLASCQDKKEEKLNIQPETSQIRAICELATMECYYHNVAKYYDKDAGGILLWKQDRHFWIEYSGVVRIGIDTSLVTLNVEDDLVTITIPEAKILSCRVDESTLTEDSFIVAQDSAKVEAEHEKQAFSEAEAELEKSAAEDKSLLVNAQLRAQSLLEDYVKNIGKLVDKEYKIKWVYVNDKSEVIDEEMSKENESAEDQNK